MPDGSAHQLARPDRHKHFTVQTLHHNTAANLLYEGVDTFNIALWPGRQRTHSADAYFHTHIAIKRERVGGSRVFLPSSAPG